MQPKLLVISNSNPLSNQLQKLTGDTYNSHDFTGSTAADGVLTHIKTGATFTVLNEAEASARKIKARITEIAEMVDSRGYFNLSVCESSWRGWDIDEYNHRHYMV